MAAMKIVIRDTPDAAAQAAAEQIAGIVRAKAAPVIGLATGSSPQPLYAALERLVRRGLDLSTARAFALDEYVGLDPEHPESYHSIIRRDVTGPLRLDPSRVFVPNGTAVDINAAAADYDDALAAARGIDIQILGIGANGHIGFNEPGSPSASRTRAVTLTHETRLDNSRFFPTIADVPTKAVSQGIGTILEARTIVLVANGANKAAAVRDAIEGQVNRSSPASHLQHHPDVTFYLDLAAAGELNRATKGSRDLNRAALASDGGWSAL
jgi:glucosamine-6-phosphate deaminase